MSSDAQDTNTPMPEQDIGLIEVVDESPQSMGEVVDDYVSLDEFEEELPPLQPKHAAFVREYMLDLNATQAYIRAGGDERQATARASQLMRRHDVRYALKRALEQRNVRVGISADAVLYELVNLGLSSIDHYQIDADGNVALTKHAPESAMRAIQSIKRRVRESYDKEGALTGRTIEVELKLWDKTKPLHLVAKHVGLRVDRVQLEGPNGGPIPVKVIREIVDVDG